MKPLVTGKDKKLFVKYIAGPSKPAFQIICVTLTICEIHEMCAVNVDLTGSVSWIALKHKPPHEEVNDSVV